MIHTDGVRTVAQPSKPASSPRSGATLDPWKVTAADYAKHVGRLGGRAAGENRAAMANMLGREAESFLKANHR